MIRSYFGEGKGRRFIATLTAGEKEVAAHVYELNVNVTPH